MALIKSNKNNEEQYKTQFVTEGYSQIPSTDYLKTYMIIQALMQLVAY